MSSADFRKQARAVTELVSGGPCCPPGVKIGPLSEYPDEITVYQPLSFVLTGVDHMAL